MMDIQPRSGSSTLYLPPAPHDLAVTLLNHVSEAVVCTDSALTIVYVNPASEQLFGYRSEDLIGTPLRSLLSTPDTERRSNGSWDGEVGFGPASGWLPQTEHTGVRKDGARITVEVRTMPVEAGGQRYVAFMIHDRTAKRQADEEQRLLQTLTLAIARASDLQKAMQLFLQKIGDVTGWTAGETWLPDASGLQLRRGPVWSREPALAEFHSASVEFAFRRGEGLPGRVWLTGRVQWVEEISQDVDFVRGDLAHMHGLRSGVAIPVLAADAVVAVVVFYNTEVRDRDPRLAELVCTIASQLGTLIQRRQTEEVLQRHAEDLARSNAELEQFAYVASHDLQEPLRMVASYSQLLAKRYGHRLDGDAHEFIGYAVEGVTRMQQLIHDLLAFSRIGTRGDSFRSTALDGVLDRVVRDMAPALHVCGAQVSRDSLPVVCADETQIYQVFQNLIENAVKFRGGHAPRLHISAKRQDEGWTISVEDNGIGIDTEYFSRIFVLFQRLHSRAEYPGTGIGLAICKKIVERHGGRIWLESERGKGSTFHFFLPDRVADPMAAS